MLTVNEEKIVFVRDDREEKQARYYCPANNEAYNA